MISLRQLRYLDALARARHFGRAAELVNVSQPALSMQIKDMEDQLGTSLIERRRNDIRLTPVGVEVHRRGQEILNAARDLTDFARHGEKLLAGPLSLGIIPSIAPYLLPATLPLLRGRFPELQLRLRETQTRTLVDELAAGDLDVILLSLPLQHPDIETKTLFEDRFVYVTNAHDAAVKKSKRVELSAVDESRLLLLEEGHCLRDQALQFCRTAHRATAGKPDLGAASLSTIMQLISNGFGTTLLPEMALRAEIGTNPHVRASRFSNPEPSRQIGLAWRRKSARKRDFMALGETFRDAHSAKPAPHQ